MNHTPVAFFGSEPQYLDHLQPVLALCADATLWVPAGLLEHATRRGLNPERFDRPVVGGDKYLWVVASTKDARLVERRFPGVPTVALCHGAGHTYDPGLNGRGSHSTRLFLTPNTASVGPIVADNPHMRVQAVGSPFMDDWVRQPAPNNPTPVVALSWHWEGAQVPETRSAWPHYRKAVEALAAQQDRLPYRLVGHGHPRAWGDLEPWYRQIGVEPVKDWLDVVRTADVYVCDNSSTMFQWAALNRPVLTLNAPWYRRDINHGLRFWDGVPGLQCDNPADLGAQILATITDPPEAQTARTAGVFAAFGNLDGQASQRAADLITVEAALLSEERDPGPVALTGRLGTVTVERATWDLLATGVLVKDPEGRQAFVATEVFYSHLQPRGWREVRNA